jgi:hypothetical protein
MFSFLFGKAKKPKEAVTPPTVPSSTTMDTLAMLQKREADIEKRIQMLECQSRTVGEAALEANRAGQRQKALGFIQKRKMYEEQIETNRAMIMRLLQQRTALETSQMNTETLNAQREANKVIKKQQESWNPDTVANLTEETQELMENSREITNLLREPVGYDLPTEADLDAELAELTASTLAAPMPAPMSAPVPASTADTIDTTVPVFPSVPTHTPVSSKPRTMQEELAILEAM